jgi:ribonuclease HI
VDTSPHEWVKLNTDATYSQETGDAGIGIIVRDEGKVLLSAWRGCGSPEQGEAEACLEGLRLTAEWVRQPTIVESDCQNLIQDVQGPIDARASQAGMLKEIKGAIRLLPGCKLNHVRSGTCFSAESW